MLLSNTDASNEVRINTARFRSYDAKVLVCHVTKFRNLTRWQTQIPFEKVLRDLLGYWRERVLIGHTH